LLAVDTKGKVTWWDTVTWQAVRTFVVDVESVWAGAISPDAHLLAVGTRTGAVRWLNAETGEPLAPPGAGHRLLVNRIGFSRDGTRAATVAQDGFVAIWDLSSFERIAHFKGHMQASHGVAFSPDGRRLATGAGQTQSRKEVFVRG